MLQPLWRRLQTLWRRAFPVRILVLTEWRDAEIPPALDQFGEPVPPDDLLQDLVEAYRTCRPLFAWLNRERARKEKLYRALPPQGTREDFEQWQRNQLGLNAQLAFITRALRIPVIANERLKLLAKLAEQRKASESEMKALEDFFADS